ncbi:hypothetical protein PMIN05_000553 [Paraphaeosphaeria minitans]
MAECAHMWDWTRNVRGAHALDTTADGALRYSESSVGSLHPCGPYILGCDALLVVLD